MKPDEDPGYGNQRVPMDWCWWNAAELYMVKQSYNQGEMVIGTLGSADVASDYFILRSRS